MPDWKYWTGPDWEKHQAISEEIMNKSKKPWEDKRMTFNEYQKQSKKTANYHGCMDYASVGEQATPENVESLIYCSLGLAGEAGEVVENIKKFLRDDNSELTQDRKGKIMAELGDVLWYVANLADAVGYTLEEVAEYNIIKLKKRYQKQELNKFVKGQQPERW